jgi:hypothetical protein
MYIPDLDLLPSRILDPSNEKKKEKEKLFPMLFFAAINFTKFRNFELTDY